jgi:OmpA-OmpF porin, OOP family
MKRLQMLVFSAMILLGTVAGAQEMPKTDLPGGKDHPLVSRYAGSILVGYKTKVYDELWMPSGPFDPSKEPPYKSIVRLEGKITQIAYDYPSDRSSLEVMRNFKSALQAAGFQTLFTCDKETCGADFGDMFIHNRIVMNELNIRTTDEWAPFNFGRNDERYILTTAKRSGGAVVHISVYVVSPVSQQLGGVYIEVLEGAAMETGKVSANLTADQMAKTIAAEGKVAVYGIYFDTDRAEIKPESKPALDEMGKLLQQNPKLSVYIVGHTDNQGTFTHNVDLSQRRADAVVQALLANYHVPQAQLAAKGVASLAPVAPNDSEDGRAKNRRVELVRQ